MTQSPWYQSLTVQIVALMTLALFPLGAIAIYQTARVAMNVEENVKLTTVTLTEQAAREERDLIDRAAAAIDFFGEVAEPLGTDRENCAQVLAQYIAANEGFSFFGLLPNDGDLSCVAVSSDFDAEQLKFLSAELALAEPGVSVSRALLGEESTAFMVSSPYFVGGTIGGTIAIIIPGSRLQDLSDELVDQGLQDLITFNANGEILTTRTSLSSAMQELPADRDLVSLATGATFNFSGVNAEGESRRFTIVPLSDGPAYVLGVWDADGSLTGQLTQIVRPAIFPVLMWFASMGVAMLALDRLVLRHLRRMRSQMDAFADNRSIAGLEHHDPMPTELEALQKNFQQMTDEVMRDEARLEDALHEKGVLVKEIHHRVKNNLQLISSMMNMQIRNASHDETRHVLSRVQDRVLSLATIHRDLYQSGSGGRVNVGPLLAEIVQKSVEISDDEENRVAVSTDIAAVRLYPDQAVPLSLLVAEAATNAMKYIGSEEGTRPRLAMTLGETDSECVLILENSLGPQKTTVAESSGMGSQLMNAFAIQLGAKVDVEETEQRYRLQVRFAPLEFIPDARDY